MTKMEQILKEAAIIENSDAYKSYIEYQKIARIKLIEQFKEKI